MGDKIKAYSATPYMYQELDDAFPGIKPIGSVENFPQDMELLILTGGSDINPSLYGQSLRGAVGWNDERDKDEYEIAVKAMRNKIPVFGICRGLQMLNVIHGGSLIQDLNSIGQSHGYHHDIKHNKEFESVNPFTWLSAVNSLHHQAIWMDGMLRRPKVLATHSKFGTPEIAYYGNELGVQFHPEMFSGDMYKKFFDIIKAWVKGDLKLVDSKKETKRNPYNAMPLEYTDIDVEEIRTVQGTALTDLSTALRLEFTDALMGRTASGEGDNNVDD